MPMKKHIEIILQKSDLFRKLLAKQLKDFPKDEREEIMYEIHGLILNKRRRCHSYVLQPSHAMSCPQGWGPGVTEKV